MEGIRGGRHLLKNRMHEAAVSMFISSEIIQQLLIKAGVEADTEDGIFASGEEASSIEVAAIPTLPISSLPSPYLPSN